ncbi:MAG: nucleotidyltransferase domain-containing protein [Chitinophagaceae bacterium]
MRTTILNKLQHIAKEHDIHILYACESGSRGWQFPSPDSDYDIRFIYAKPFSRYLSVSEQKYQLSFPLSKELDIYGWDIRKVLQLVRKSNTTPFEWLQSPIVYMAEDGFRDALWSLCNQYFSPRSNIHHYLGIAYGALESMTTTDEIDIKKLFYVLRPLLAAKWCLEKNSIAPMTIEPLMSLLPDTLYTPVQELIAFKSTVNEDHRIVLAPSFRSFIAEEMSRILTATKSIPHATFGSGLLDEFFINTIRHYDYT